MVKSVRTRIDRVAEDAHVVGCSVKGPSHEESDTPCQDAWAGTTLPKSRLVIAVSDGLGSATHSQEGAQLATQEVVDRLSQYLDEERLFEQNELERGMKRAFSDTRTALSDQADELDVQPSALSATLLAVVAGPSGAAAAAVGDGGIVGHQRGSHSFLIPREDTEYANETTPIQSDHWEDSYRFRYRKNVDAVALFSDGLDPFAWDISGGDSPRPELFDQIFEYFRTTRDPDEATQDLCDFLNQENFRRYSGDDKTVAIGVLPTESWSARLFEWLEEPKALSDLLGARSPNE